MIKVHEVFNSLKVKEGDEFKDWKELEERLGSEFKNSIYSDDRDGQYLYSIEGTVSGINIEDCEEEEAYPGTDLTIIYVLSDTHIDG